ncbi:MAG TPA: hypothetical protein VF756_29480 [Thermoanaerobaculia bacterium]
MAEQKGAKRAPESLESKALQSLAKRAGDKEVTLSAADRGVVPSTGKTLSRFRASPKERPNDLLTVVFDESGAEVDLAKLSERDRATVFAPPKWTIDPGELEAPPAPSGIEIDPLFNDLILEPGDSLHEVITVTVPKSAGVSKADVYILADTTGSMGTILAAVQAGANAMLGALQGLGIDMAFGVGNYRDFPIRPGVNSYAFQHQQSLTQTVADVTNAINAWTAAEGSDGSEGQFFALDQLAQPPGGTIGWRTGSKRIIVWFGDAPGHDPICAGISGLGADITEASATLKLVNENITVLAISTTTSYPNGLDDDPQSSVFDYTGTCAIAGASGQASRIASQTGGAHETGIDPTKIVNTIIDLVKKAVGQIKNLSLVAAGGTKPFVVSISPAGGYGPLAGDKDHVLFFDVDFKGVKPCSDEEQVFNGTLDVVADEVVVAQKRVRIVVPPCRLYSYSVKFVCGVQEDCKCEEGPVRPGVYATEINIYNDGDDEAAIEKWVVPIVFAGAAAGREPGIARPRARDTIVLPPKSATMDDCHRLGELLFGAHPASPMALTLGFLEIVSREPLNVVAVYTVTGLQNGPVSIEVETVQPRLKRARPRRPTLTPHPTSPTSHT